MLGTATGNGRDLEAPGAELVKQEGGKFWLRFDPVTTPVPALIAGIAARYLISDLSIEEPELEPVIRQIYQERRVTI